MLVADTERVTIAGAGMAGTLLSILLARRGLEIELFEQYPDPRGNDISAGQSVDLALGERAQHALLIAGLLEKVDAHCTAMRGRMIHDRSGRITVQPYGTTERDALHSVRRRHLQTCLLDEAEACENIRIRFHHQLRSIDWQSRRIKFVTHPGGDDSGHREHPFEVLIGADGAVSPVRRSMANAADIGASEVLLDTGYKLLSIPANEQGGPCMDPGGLHVWPRGGYMMIAFPHRDGSFSAKLFLPRSGDHKMIWGFGELDSWTRQRAFMEANFPDATPLMPELRQEFRDNPTGMMGTVRCRQWHLGGRGLLIGDAAHAIVPFHGQGVNAALEDCTTLVQILETGVKDWESVFRALQEQRKENTDAIADMSMDAFRTMRDSVRHRDFLLRKALERELERRHPERFVARYSLVMFHRIPYIEAYRRGKVQAKILDELLDGKDQLTEVDLEMAARLVGERLSLISD